MKARNRQPAPAAEGSMRSTTRDRWLSLAGAGAIFAALSPTLARTPQSGDGAEVVMTAVRGGVLHPPGFPLQAWLDRGLAAFPGLPHALAISGMGLAAHAVAAFLLAETLGRLGAGLTARLFAMAAFALFPAVWGIAVQPEVFSLAHLFVAAALLVAVREPRPGTTASATAGLIGGLGLATHPVFLAALPAVIVAGLRVAAAGPRRALRVALFVSLLIGLPALLYLSLPLLRTASPWPDWGALRSVPDVARHVLRLDYGAFAFSAAEGAATLSGLAVWARDLAMLWNAGVVLGLLGAWQLFRRTGAACAVAVLGTMVIALAILARATLPQQSYSAAYLEKLQGPAVLVGALLLGLGLDAARRKLRGAAARRLLDSAAAAAAVAWLVLGWPRADASRDRTLELHQRGVAQELNAEMVYVTGADVESFMGISTAQGSRLPILDPSMSLDWYWREVAPRIEPRVLGRRPALVDWADFLRLCFEAGLPVAGTSRPLIATSAATPELRGLLYVARPGQMQEFTAATIEAARRLVPIAGLLPALPPGRRELSRYYARRFARAYAGAAEALRARGAAQAGAAADSVERSILRGDPPHVRARALDAFLAATATR
ncbi:MAG: DUF2723 domain-containing protein [Candidatus Eisenbacteria bacterium]